MMCVECECCPAVEDDPREPPLGALCLACAIDAWIVEEERLTRELEAARGEQARLTQRLADRNHRYLDRCR